MKHFLVVGAGGFIAGHLVNRLLTEGCKVTAVDIKPLEFWFQKFDKAQNYHLDMSDYINCEKMTENIITYNVQRFAKFNNNVSDFILSFLFNLMGRALQFKSIFDAINDNLKNQYYVDIANQYGRMVRIIFDFEPEVASSLLSAGLAGYSMNSTEWEGVL